MRERRWAPDLPTPTTRPSSESSAPPLVGGASGSNCGHEPIGCTLATPGDVQRRAVDEQAHGGHGRQLPQRPDDLRGQLLELRWRTPAAHRPSRSTDGDAGAVDWDVADQVGALRDGRGHRRRQRVTRAGDQLMDQRRRQARLVRWHQHRIGHQPGPGAVEEVDRRRLQRARGVGGGEQKTVGQVRDPPLPVQPDDGEAGVHRRRARRGSCRAGRPCRADASTTPTACAVPIRRAGEPLVVQRGAGGRSARWRRARGTAGRPRSCCRCRRAR